MQAHHRLALVVFLAIVGGGGGCGGTGEASSTKERQSSDDARDDGDDIDPSDDNGPDDEGDNEPSDNEPSDNDAGDDDNGSDNDPGDSDSDPGDDDGSDPGPVDPPPNGCSQLTVAKNSSVSSFMSDVYTWQDSQCRPRSAAMVRNNAQDPSGKYGGYMRRYTYTLDDDETRSCQSSNNDHPGFGYLVNHINGGSVSSRRNSGSHAIAFEGRHHAIHQYSWTYNVSGKPMTATVQWMFATGRDHPLWAVTFDTTAAGRNAINADTRAPYGDIDWDGGARSNVTGVAWGDRYKFTSLGGPITLNSGWDYTEPNTIPYVIEWSDSTDAEMGLVQTQTYLQHDAGGYGFYSGWGKRDDNGPMPADYNWPYQLNQYELPWGSASKRLAWGMNYGAVGNAAYSVFGNDGTASGYPYQSYSVFVALDTHTKAPVHAQVAQMETVQDTTLTAQKGSVKTSGPAGLARTDTITYEPAGYNPIYATWELTAAANEVDATLTVPAASTLQSPVLVVHGWTKDAAPTSVTLKGRALTADVDFYASVDPTKDVLWLTLAGAHAGANRVTLK